MSERLAGKVALVTGAGSGIGREIVTRFAAEGASVAAADVRGSATAETAAALGGGGIGVEMDVTSSTGIDEAVRTVVERFGGLDVVVNNAGVTIVGAAYALDEADWDRELDTNLNSPTPRRLAGPRWDCTRSGGSVRTRDIADAFVYLASDEAAWVTGTALVVDGGLTSGIWRS